jgi:hypothetical protein
MADEDDKDDNYEEKVCGEWGNSSSGATKY